MRVEGPGIQYRPLDLSVHQRGHTLTGECRLEMTLLEFEALRSKLPEYSASQPTGAFVGKMWLRNENWKSRSDVEGAWWVAEFVPSPTKPETHLATTWRRIVIVPLADAEVWRRVQLDKTAENQAPFGF